MTSTLMVMGGRGHYRTDAAARLLAELLFIFLVRDKRPNQGCLADRDPNIFIGGRGVCSIRVLGEKVRVRQWLNW